MPPKRKQRPGGAGVAIGGENSSPAGGAESGGRSKVDVDKVIGVLLESCVSKVGKNCEIPSGEADLVEMCQWTKRVFVEQPMLLELHAPIKIVGDVMLQSRSLQTSMGSTTTFFDF